MQTARSIPDLAETGVLDGGHLWIEELIDGDPLRFRITDSGLLEFGGPEQHYDRQIPLKYRHATRAIRATIRRDPLRDALTDPTRVTIMGVAAHRRSTQYDWDRIPSFLGTDIFDEEQESYVSPDRARQVFDQLGLPSVNTFDREVRAQSFDRQTYSMPKSNWRGDLAAGIVLRNKAGAIGRIDGSIDHTWRAEPITDLQNHVHDRITRDWISKIRDRTPVSIGHFEELIDCAVREFARESARVGIVTAPNPDVLRSEIAQRINELQ